MPQISARFSTALESVKQRDLSQLVETEAWDSMPVWAREFDTQLEAAVARIETVQQRLADLAANATNEQ
ncbi:MAG: hypothetical protein QF921_11220 [Pseudomonadales bacterium]|jgi:hypothetical protein|nr:hypothetical protein [Pseudomonadales bacterium]MDP6470100.1 hypothetical protein [Pseudomonadales bacterium]MDP6827003.1 hypothetical protein [Pseudomonadales bacterium]MDP6972061.1 hypothetical protein [Pseudomonadales bacterium]|tara:strand:- start:404 stop:610 length:207 start_codon:yes stop_codon:yes gene_type:complete